MKTKGKRAALVAVCAVSLLGLLLASVGSTAVLKMSLEDLAWHATSIVECEVTGVESAWDQPHVRIYTYVTLNVTGVYAGAHQPGPLTIRILGGAVDDMAMDIPEAPRFAEGEHLILFLEEGAFLIPVVGLTQGKLTVSVDPETGEERIGNPEIGFFGRQELLDRIAQARQGG